MRNWVKNWIVHVIRMCVHGMWNRCYPLFLLCRIAFFYLVVRYFVRWMSVERLRNQFENSIAENGTVWCVYFYHSTNSDEKKMSFFVKTKVFFGDKRNTKKKKAVQCTVYTLNRIIAFFSFCPMLVVVFLFKLSFFCIPFVIITLATFFITLFCTMYILIAARFDRIFHSLFYKFDCEVENIMPTLL